MKKNVTSRALLKVYLIGVASLVGAEQAAPDHLVPAPSELASSYRTHARFLERVRAQTDKRGDRRLRFGHRSGDVVTLIYEESGKVYGCVEVLDGDDNPIAQSRREVELGADVSSEFLRVWSKELRLTRYPKEGVVIPVYRPQFVCLWSNKANYWYEAVYWIDREESNTRVFHLNGAVSELRNLIQLKHLIKPEVFREAQLPGNSSRKDLVRRVAQSREEVLRLILQKEEK